jgi:hypothetical protein
MFLILLNKTYIKAKMITISVTGPMKVADKYQRHVRRPVTKHKAKAITPKTT